MSKKEIIHFLSDYEKDIFESHAKEIKSCIELMSQNEGRSVTHSIYGEHFADCIYALKDNDLVPETCECVFYQMRRSNICDMIKKYKYLLLVFDKRKY